MSLQFGTRTTLLVLTSSALASVYVTPEPLLAIALGLSYAVLQVLALRLTEAAFTIGKPGIHADGGGLPAPPRTGSHGLRAVQSALSPDNIHWAFVLQHVSLVAAMVTLVAALSLEGLHFDGLVYFGLVGRAMGEHWIVGQAILSTLSGLTMVAIHSLMDAAFLFMVSRSVFFPCFLQSSNRSQSNCLCQAQAKARRRMSAWYMGFQCNNLSLRYAGRW